MRAVRTLEGKDPGKTVFIGREACPTDFAQQLSGFAVVAVEIGLWSFAGRAGAVFWDVTLRAAADRHDRFAISPGIVAVKILIIPVLMVMNDLWELIHLELLVFWGVGIIKGPLPERDISADKTDQPAVLLIKLLN